MSSKPIITASTSTPTSTPVSAPTPTEPPPSWRKSVTQEYRSQEIRSIAEFLSKLEDPHASISSKLAIASRFEKDVFDKGKSLNDYKKKITKRLRKLSQNYKGGAAAAAAAASAAVSGRNGNNTVAAAVTVVTVVPVSGNIAGVVTNTSTAVRGVPPPSLGSSKHHNSTPTSSIVNPTSPYLPNTIIPNNNNNNNTMITNTPTPNPTLTHEQYRTEQNSILKLEAVLRKKYGKSLLFIVEHKERAIHAILSKGGSDNIQKAQTLRLHTENASEWAVEIGVVPENTLLIGNITNTTNNTNMIKVKRTKKMPRRLLHLQNIEGYLKNRLDNIRTHVVKLATPNLFLEECLDTIGKELVSNSSNSSNSNSSQNSKDAAAAVVVASPSLLMVSNDNNGMTRDILSKGAAAAFMKHKNTIKSPLLLSSQASSLESDELNKSTTENNKQQQQLEQLEQQKLEQKWGLDAFRICLNHTTNPPLPLVYRTAEDVKKTGLIHLNRIRYAAETMMAYLTIPNEDIDDNDQQQSQPPPNKKLKMNDDSSSSSNSNSNNNNNKNKISSLNTLLKCCPRKMHGIALEACDFLENMYDNDGTIMTMVDDDYDVNNNTASLTTTTTTSTTSTTTTRNSNTIISNSNNNKPVTIANTQGKYIVLEDAWNKMMKYQQPPNPPPPPTTTPPSLSQENNNSNEIKQTIPKKRIKHILRSKVLFTPGNNPPTIYLNELRKKGGEVRYSHSRCDNVGNGGVGSGGSSVAGATLVMRFGNAFVMHIYFSPLMVLVRAATATTNTITPQKSTTTTNTTGTTNTTNTTSTTTINDNSDLFRNEIMDGGLDVWIRPIAPTGFRSSSGGNSCGGSNFGGVSAIPEHRIAKWLDCASARATNVLRKCFAEVRYVNDDNDNANNDNTKKSNLKDFEIQMMEGSALLKFLGIARDTYYNPDDTDWGVDTMDLYTPGMNGAQPLPSN